MASSSRTDQTSTTITEDNRQIAEGGGIALSSDGGDVQLHIVPDEAFELARVSLEENASLAHAITTSQAEIFGRALRDTQAAARTESAQIGDRLITVGVPAAVVVFLLLAISEGRK